MIFVDRFGKDEAGRPIKPSQSWFKRAQAKTKLAAEERGAHEWDLSVYGDPKEVRPALEKLFNDKCAYCESSLGDGWEVEHFRPKGRVAEREDHPGYYWLGYEWTNLYASCTYCNQRRKDKPRWGDPRTLPAAGKLDQFPLLDERTRAMSPAADILKEHTLLIDPCSDNPERYLGYEPDGQIFSLGKNPYGEKTIEVFHLKRRRLRDARKFQIRLVTKVLGKIKKAKSKNNRRAARDFADLLTDLCAEDSKYAGAARFVKSHRDIFLGNG
jgi:uncharacterized protein (TIGR02646 family)